MPYITEYVYTRPPRPLRRRISIWLLLSAAAMAVILLTLPLWPQASYVVETTLPGHPSRVAMAEKAAALPPGPGNWLLIPAIGVKTPVVEGRDIGVLDAKTGVWHQNGDASQGNLVIAGHRFKYLPPNQTTFYNLDHLKPGDAITLWWEGSRAVYTVDRTFTVGRDATQILNPTSQPQLTLYTCTDLAASKRLVVIAAPVH